MRINRALPSVFILALLILAACKSSENSSATVQNKIPAGTWTLQSYGGQSMLAKAYPRGLPTIVFKDSTSFSGSTGCNQYMATYKGNAEQIDIRMGPMTKMACEGNKEQEFIDALGATNRVTLKDGLLSFYRDETSLMKFSKSGK